MKEPWWEMKYNSELECWFVTIHGQDNMMFCGTWFNLRIQENKGITCRLELAEDWYVIIGTEGARLTLRNLEVYNIQI